MVESGIDTSEFFIDIEFTLRDSGIQILKTSNGDTITALYRDTTIPDNLGTFCEFHERDMRPQRSNDREGNGGISGENQVGASKFL